MGVRFSHGEAHWSYGGFPVFRDRLANSDEPALGPLLAAPDHDSSIRAEFCFGLAGAIRRQVADWPEGHDQQQALLLAEGLEQAAAENRPLLIL